MKPTPEQRWFSIVFVALDRSPSTGYCRARRKPPGKTATRTVTVKREAPTAEQAEADLRAERSGVSEVCSITDLGPALVFKGLGFFKGVYNVERNGTSIGYVERVKARRDAAGQVVESGGFAAKVVEENAGLRELGRAATREEAARLLPGAA